MVRRGGHGERQSLGSALAGSNRNWVKARYRNCLGVSRTGVIVEYNGHGSIVSPVKHGALQGVTGEGGEFGIQHYPLAGK